MSGSKTVRYNANVAEELTSYEIVESNKEDDGKALEQLRELRNTEDDAYRINYGDVYDIFVDADNNFDTRSAIVKSDGYITVKRLGEIRVIAMTITEAKELIEQRLKKYIKIPPYLSIIPVKIKQAKINILGEVRKPGAYGIQGKIRVLDAISLAGGISYHKYEGDIVETADLRSAYITRDNEILPVDFYDLIVEGDLDHNIYVQDLDYIFIPSVANKSVYIMGEIGAPGKYILLNDLTISRLVALAGDIRNTAAANLFVIRGNLKEPTIYKINLDSILIGGLDDFRLKENDIVYIPRSAITEYNAILAKILPTLSLFNTSLNTFRNVDSFNHTIKNLADEYETETQNQ